MFGVNKNVGNCNYKLVIFIIYHVNNNFRTRCLSLMYFVNLAETSHTHRATIKLCLKNLII